MTKDAAFTELDESSGMGTRRTGVILTGPRDWKVANLRRVQVLGTIAVVGEMLSTSGREDSEGGPSVSGKEGIPGGQSLRERARYEPGGVRRLVGTFSHRGT